MNHGGVRGFSQQPVQLLLGTDPAQTLQLVLTAATSQPGAVLIALSIHRVLMAALFPRGMGSSAKLPWLSLPGFPSKTASVERGNSPEEGEHPRQCPLGAELN